MFLSIGEKDMNADFIGDLLDRSFDNISCLEIESKFIEFRPLSFVKIHVSAWIDMKLFEISQCPDQFFQ